MRDELAPVPSLSASTAHLLLSRSARHAWQAHARLNPNWKPDHSDVAELGTIAHALLVEGARDRLVVVQAKDWRTKLAQEQRELARVEGKLPILQDTFTRVETMVSVAKAALEVAEIDGTTLTQPERTLLWTEDEGLWFRARPDWLSTDKLVAVDYKTATESAEPDAWARGPLLRYGLDLQAALVLRGLAHLAQSPRECTFVFLVQETRAPFAVSSIALAPAYLDFARHRLAAAVERWRHCLERGTDAASWPSYSPRIAYVEPPGWATYAWSAAQAEPEPDDDRPLAEQLGL